MNEVGLIGFQISEILDDVACVSMVLLACSVVVFILKKIKKQ